MAKKDPQTVVTLAAEKSTNGCTFTLFRHAHNRLSLTRKKGGNGNLPLTSPPLPSTTPREVRDAHQTFTSTGKVPFWVQNFVRAGHHMQIAA